MQVLKASELKETPDDAVIVTVRAVAGRMMADVACPNCSDADEFIVADFPRPVPIAIERASEVRRACHLSRILVVLEKDAQWRPDWDRLLDGATLH